MSIELMIKLFVSLIGEYLLKPGKAAKYAKWLLTARDYLNLLFPSETYPMGVAAPHIKGMTSEKVAVPISAVEEAAKSRGFSLGSLFGG